MDVTMRRILARGDETRDGAIGLLRGLIAATALGETAVQERVAAELRALGCTVESVRYRPADVPMVEEFASDHAIDAGERVSVVGRLPGSGAGGRSLVLFAHPDGEPPADTQRWERDPFIGVMEGGRLYGWGVADDLAGVAAMVEGLRLLLEAGIQPAGDVIIASTPSKRHARGVSALLHGGLTADAALYLHPAESGAGLSEVKAFAAGQLDFRITVVGRPPATTEPHQTGFAHRAVNPVDKAMLVWKALRDLDERRGLSVRHPRLQAAVGRSTNLMVTHMACGEPERLSRVADRCVLGGAVSFPPPERLADVQAAIAAAVAEAAAGDPWLAEHPPVIHWDAGVTGAEVPEDHALWRTVSGVMQAVTGRPPHVNPMHTSSDIRNPMVQKGIPTVGLGPLCGDLTQTGGHDEWVDVDDYLRCVTATAGIIATWCGAGRPPGR
ncbi:M20/M25/M40 family metallo-hydrolase [Azospirillum sp. RWY-5-1]|uniref:M20/M25/M40 family metallo-hydrolase n=1 Tax=Azospirillum oleiclasticum TaxID=2735135 RepID=A0ABX2TII5_9PROT|nr:M20/M25/M40 family metallo-hydrolase [Azospirillum oleiclasticum]NYZ16485.1 M20/M25/M40 family metallo-hydrolase [Azospirillum oleiclasticum]NYZ24046.1 M20/M25/M40 family metallo-hydrolase [Azospirillum oleiclasticum]